MGSIKKPEKEQIQQTSKMEEEEDWEKGLESLKDVAKDGTDGDLDSWEKDLDDILASN